MDNVTTQADIRIRNNKERIVAYLEQGLFFKDACLRAGINESTGHRYKQKDASFASRVEAGIAKYKEKLINCVNAGAIKNAWIALEVLKIRFPEQWNPVRRVQSFDPQEELKKIHDMIYGSTCPREAHQ
jgi:hypothetical protein